VDKTKGRPNRGRADRTLKPIREVVWEKEKNRKKKEGKGIAEKLNLDLMLYDTIREGAI